ncbi:MAG: SRPBCC family protein [Chitinophagaceae bacterium]
MIFIYIFATLIIGILLAAAFMPAVYNISQTIVINRPSKQVMNRISNLNEYALWNPWQQSDPSSIKTITGTAGTPDHKYAWEGKRVGKGSLTLRNINNNEIHFDLEFLKPWKAKAKDNWRFDTINENETKVRWQNNGELPWPVARLMGPMLNKNLTHQFRTGLINLKKLSEA